MKIEPSTTSTPIARRARIRSFSTSRTRKPNFGRGSTCRERLEEVLAFDRIGENAWKRSGAGDDRCGRCEDLRTYLRDRRRPSPRLRRGSNPKRRATTKEEYARLSVRDRSRKQSRARGMCGLTVTVGDKSATACEGGLPSVWRQGSRS